jgi:chromosome segregation ATPase
MGLLRRAVDLLDDIKSFLRSDLENRMTVLSDAVDRLADAVTTELQQVADALSQIAAKDQEADALRAELEDLQASIQPSIDRIEGLADELKADDPNSSEAEPVPPPPEAAQ